MKKINQLLASARRMHGRSSTAIQASIAGITVLAAVGVALSQSPPPLIELASEPLYINGSKTKANLTLALSVEFPTVGQTYRDTFDEAKTYVGYFDNKSCYRHVPSNGAKGAYFDWAKAPTSSGDCGGGGFNGNFMNWATSSAIDIMRYGLTGGNRTTDEDTGNHLTIVERAYLPNGFYRNGSYFGEKVLPNALVKKMIETSVANKIGSADMYIYNCKNRVYFAKSKDDKSNSGCDNPFEVADAKSDQLVGPNNNDTYYEVRNLVCDPNSATNRLMSYDPDTKKWKGLCFRYPSGKYKPVGQLQVNSENLRIAVFGYLQNNNRSSHGGVMRAPLKYVGPKAFDNSFNLIAGDNPRAEWNKTTGVFVDNPQAGDATYGDQTYPRSGAIMYINKFGTLDPDNIGLYKSLDPVSEMYYDAIRYLQGKQPTPASVTDATNSSAANKKLKENYPVYHTWTDPFTGFVDSSTSGKSCLRNSILTIADVFTHSDKTVPGNSRAANEDLVRAAESAPALDAEFWTNVVGAFEANKAMAYTDSQGRAQTTANLGSNTHYTGLENAGTQDTGSNGGSYLMAGLAYWANTQSFRPDVPRARVTTFSIDVNERRASDNVDFRRQRQLYLAAKYGGFDDAITGTGNPGNTGSPFATGDNTLWRGSDGDAENYFLVSDAQKFLDSIADVFAKVVEETGSIAGGAISTQRLTSGQAAGVFQARFNPVANFWSGRLLRYPLSLSSDETTLVLGSTATWEAGDVMTKAAKIDFGTSRKIFVGPPPGLQGTVAASEFKWASLHADHQTTLSWSLTGTSTDSLGEERVKYIRGDQRKEISNAAPNNPFRPRDSVLGAIVNSGLVFQGRPSISIADDGYQAFFEANKSRVKSVFVNANDGMLHAFNDTNGAEIFAFVPGFLAGKLKALPDQDYSHISIADATPVIGEAKVGTSWKSVLVSGVGGGGQGVYAIDVTDPSSFSASNVMWEFTDRDHSAMGNVIGSPRILKVRTTNSNAATPAYKWFAVVPSGVNNNAPDGRSYTGGNASLFFLDLSFVPSATDKWQEGTNFWRIELDQTVTTMAKGLSGFTPELDFNTSSLKHIFAGDLQGNMWKLDFSLNGFGGANIGTNGLTNLAKFTKGGGKKPIFVAKDSANALQPMTGEPTVTRGLNGNNLVAFGTGKFLEISDLTVPLAVGASFYNILDQDRVVTGRTQLQAGSLAANGTVTFPTFVYGSATTAQPDLKMGWYFDLDKASAERQVSDITAVAGKLLFGSLYPTKGSCGEGGGRFYALDTLGGTGSGEESKVGILAAPLVIEIGSPVVTPRETTGKRFGSRRLGVITQGSRGIGVATGAGGAGYSTAPVANSYLSWRQLHNFQENRNAP